jgi:hypothetical protein
MGKPAFADFAAHVLDIACDFFSLGRAGWLRSLSVLYGERMLWELLSSALV